MEEDFAGAGPYISSVEVEGLHGQFDVKIDLGPGLNVIYGKNGRGKTTMLHLVANLLELDFQRFRYLQFLRLAVRTSGGDEVEIERDEGSPHLRVKVNGALTSIGNGDGPSPLEMTSLRGVLGGRATYLPAFRSVLERARAESSAYYRYGERKSPDFDSIQRAEFLALKEVASDTVLGRRVQDEAASSAEKTLLCRKWFGNFVPVIRYPAISDVEESLVEEFRRAQFEVTAKEQRMFEETFVRVFRVSAGLETIPSHDSNEGILQEISKLLENQNSLIGNDDSRETNQLLLDSARQLGSIYQPGEGVNNYLLEVYRKALSEREHARNKAFSKTREFEKSVNRFLDKKAISIGRSSGNKRIGRSSVVSVSTDAGHSYGLSALSSGERQIVTMLYSASRTKFTSGMVLVDEPELSLHIDWQRIILRELTKQAPNRQIVVCTHSPEVGADHFEDVQDFEPLPSVKRQAVLFDEIDQEEEN